MSVALPCDKCGGMVVGTKHVFQSQGCGTPKDAQVVRLNPTGQESLQDILANIVKVMRP